MIRRLLVRIAVRLVAVALGAVLTIAMTSLHLRAERWLLDRELDDLVREDARA